MSSRFLSYGPLCSGFWLRVLGYGLYVQKRPVHVPMFSERYGHRPLFYVGPLVSGVLR